MSAKKLTISVAEARALLGLSQTTFWGLRKSDPGFPKPLKIAGARKLFDRRSFLEWCEKVGINIEEDAA